MFRKAVWWAGLLLVSAQLGAAPMVRVSTSMGDFVVELNPQRAPLTTENFLRYVKEGFYDGTLFHRVVSNFVVQGGGYAAADRKLKKPHDSIANESGNGLQNLRGTVGLARTETAHSGNAQFYVNLADNPDLDPVSTRWGYAVFGKIVQGMDVLERIGVLPTGAVGPFKGESPIQQVVIQKVELLAAAPGSIAPVAPMPSASPPSAPANAAPAAQPAPAEAAPAAPQAPPPAESNSAAPAPPTEAPPQAR